MTASIPRRVVDSFSKRAKPNTEPVDLLTEWVDGLNQKRVAVNRFGSGYTAGNPITQIDEKRPVPSVSEAGVRAVPKHIVQQEATEPVDK